MGVLKGGLGCMFGGGIAIGLMVSAHQGYGIAAVLGVMMGLCVWGLISGIANLAGKKLHPGIGGGIAAVIALVSTFVGPTVSTSYAKGEERDAWKKLTKAEKDENFIADRWKTEYVDVIDDKFERPEWQEHFFSARARQAAKSKNTQALRELLKEIDESKDNKRFKEAREIATKAFSEIYDKAKAKMFAPTTGGAEFPVDPELRGAFATLLGDLAQSPDPNVYVAFVNAAKLDAPEGTDKQLTLMRSDPQVRGQFPGGDAPVIDPGQAFSSSYDSRRRQTFIAAMSESFGKVFEDASLLSLVPLDEKGDRKNKIIFEVSSNIRRTPDFYVYTRTTGAAKTVAGLLFAIEVEWGFKILDRSGKVLYSPKPIVSLPADELRVSRGENDPQWAMYSVMMDSAYYNYARRVTGNFGLVPPPVKESFSYSGAGDSSPTPTAAP